MDDSAQEEQVSQTYFESKVVYQRKALFIKNFLLQKKSKISNIMQLLTPLVALCLIQFIGTVGKDLFMTIIEDKID